MTITAVSGPTVSFGTTLTSSGVDLEHNPDRGPSAADLGEMLLDPRPQFSFQPGQGATKPFYGWAGLFGGPVVDAIPQTISSNGIVAQQVPAASSALTLATSSGSSSVVSVSLSPPEGGANITINAIDGAMAGAAFGVSGTVNIWDPTKAIARGLTIVKSSNGDAGNWTIAGRDLYGFKMTESLVSSGNTTMNTKKTYKYISSILPGSAVTSTGVIVGTQDMFGFPLRVDQAMYATVWVGPSSNSQLISVSTGAHTFAVTSAASNTTGDVRGTITSSVASNSTAAAPVRIGMLIGPSVANLASMGSTNFAGLVGLPQFSSV